MRSWRTDKRQIHSINTRDTRTVLADHAERLGDQPLSARTREAYLAAVTAFVAWLDQRDAGPSDALAAPGRDLPARDYKRHMKVKRALSPASVNQALPARSPDSLPRARGAINKRPLPHPPD